MGCDVWEVVARKSPNNIHRRGNLQKRKAKAKFTRKDLKEMKGIKVFSIAIAVAIAIGPSHSDF